MSEQLLLTLSHLITHSVSKAGLLTLRSVVEFCGKTESHFTHSLSFPPSSWMFLTVAPSCSMWTQGLRTLLFIINTFYSFTTAIVDARSQSPQIDSEWAWSHHFYDMKAIERGTIKRVCSEPTAGEGLSLWVTRWPVYHKTTWRH